MIYRCIKTVVMDPTSSTPYVAFTEGKLYEGQRSNEPDGTPAISFTNDQGDEHLSNGAWHHEHFELVDGGDREEWEFDE